MFFSFFFFLAWTQGLFADFKFLAHGFVILHTCSVMNSPSVET